MKKYVLQELDLHPTNACNLKCKFCSYDSGVPVKNQLSLEEIKKIIKEATELGLEELHITGGEPTLRKDLEEIISFANSFSLHIRMQTNGLTLSKKRLKSLKKSGLDNLMISIDGFEDTHDFLRGVKGANKKTVSAIRSAVELGYNVRVNSVVCSYNIKEIPKILPLISSLGVKIYSAFIFSPIGRGERAKELLVLPESWKKFLEEMKKEVKKHKELIAIIEKGYFWSDEPKINFSVLRGCGAGCHNLPKQREYLIVKSDGEVFPCVFFVHSNHSLGNVRKTSFKKILFNSPEWEFYKSLSKRTGRCVKCDDWYQCMGGCRGYSYLFCRSWNAPDPRCFDFSNEKKFFPLCPILKLNAKTNKFGGSSEQAMST